MFNRQKVLLYLILALERRGETISKTTLDKMLFVLRKETSIGESIKFYNFYPHNFGPFSNLFYFDLADLKSRGYVNESFGLSEEAEKIADSVGDEEKRLVDITIERLAKADLVDYVYGKYPAYTIRSQLKNRKPRMQEPGIFSIGYEKKDIDLFLDMLISNGINVLVDVRANPFSMNPSFTKGKLQKSLSNVQIEYLHIPELGISSGKRHELQGEALFGHYGREVLPKQAEKVGMLAELGKRKRIALMCMEASSRDCHRGVLSGKLEETGAKVIHL